MDEVIGKWIHVSGITGSGTWNFGADSRQDKVEIVGDKGVIRFSVFGEESIILEREGKPESLFIENPDPIQLYHVSNMGSGPM